jgi:hypothetical protein
LGERIDRLIFIRDGHVFIGGLLGQFGVWTKRAVELLEAMKAARQSEQIPLEWLN